MSSDTVNKLIALALMVVLIAVYTLSAVIHYTIPTAIDTIAGVVIGFAAHAFGVVNTVQAVKVAVSNGLGSSQQTPPTGK